LAAIERYAVGDDCRERALLAHFDASSDARPCGRCDVCIGRHKTKVSDDEYSTLQAAILRQIRQAPVSYRDLLSQLKEGTPAQREKVLRYLMDKQIVVMGEGGKLQMGK